MSVFRVDPDFDPAVRELCRLPYPGRKGGCPFYSRRPSCPPEAPLFPDLIDKLRPVYAIVYPFNLAWQVRRMRKRHPEWTDKQCACSRYWQLGARKQLREAVNVFWGIHPECSCALMRPEANGIDVTSTMRAVGLVLEWPPVENVHLVAVAGTPRQKAEFRHSSGVPMQGYFKELGLLKS